MADAVLADEGLRRKWLRHGETWFVGVDALPNDADGTIAGVPLPARFRAIWAGAWHRAQLSVVYPGYPRQDETESDAAHRFRLRRDAAHVDGLHLEAGRRILRELHAFILGLPLNAVGESPLVVWDGSHRVMQAALAGAEIGADVTDAYKAARARVFETCGRVEITVGPGQAVLVHRLAVHGVAPWRGAGTEPRRMAYFRPELSDADKWARVDAPFE